MLIAAAVGYRQISPCVSDGAGMSAQIPIVAREGNSNNYYQANTPNKSPGAAKGAIWTKAFIRGQVPFVPSAYRVAVATVPSGTQNVDLRFQLVRAPVSGCANNNNNNKTQQDVFLRNKGSTEDSGSCGCSPGFRPLPRSPTHRRRWSRLTGRDCCSVNQRQHRCAQSSGGSD